MKILLNSCCILFSLLGFSQNIKFEGFVTDSTKVGLEMANVMAVNQTTNTMDAYAITNAKGKYILNLKANTKYEVKVSYIGFQTFTKIITTTSDTTTYDITLTEGVQLDDVEVVHEMPVKISGDTIIYNSDSFTNGTERKLEDVLKKLPGVEVNSDGEIEVEGKTVEKVMVEGKDFFDGDTKLATKNIPADALDKIQVLRNYNEVSNLKGLENNEDNIALNIKLKEGKKNFWFGDITLGTGVAEEKERHIINPKLFYYSPKYSINVIGNSNNIGELPLTMRDYFKFTGGFRNMMQKGGSSFNVSSNDLGILGLRNDQAEDIDTKFGAANFSYNPTKALSISGFGIFLGNTTQVITNSINDLPQSTTQETKQDIAKQQSNLGIVKLGTSYIPSEKSHFNYDVLAKYSNQKENQNTQSTEVGTIFTYKEQQPVSIKQNLNYYYTLNDKNVFSFEVQHTYNEENPLYSVSLEDFPFTLSGFNATQTRDNIEQNKFIKTNKTDAKFDYYYMLTPKSNINVTLGNTYSYQNFNSGIFQLLDSGVQNNLSTTTENFNDVNYSFNDTFLGLHYKIMFGQFTVTPGVNLHQYTTKNEQLNEKQTNNFTRLLPDIYAFWKIGKAENITYNFSLSNDFTDIVKLAEGNALSNYNNLFKGNRNLKNSLSQVHSLRYFKYNMFNFEHIFANVTYTKKTDAIKNSAFLSGINQTSTAVNINSNFADENIVAMGRYGRSFAKFYKASASASLNWSTYNNIRLFTGNTQNIQTTKNFTQNYSAKIATNYKKLPNISFSYTFTKNDNQSDVFYTYNPKIILEYYFLNAFSFVSEYSFYNSRNKTNTIATKYNFLSASIMYQKTNSRWEWKLSGTNLLETQALTTNSFNQLGGTSSFSSYTVQPRYIILSLKYNL